MSTLTIDGGSVHVEIEGGLISSVGKAPARSTGATGSSAPVLDADGCAVLPGFVDLQVNGALGVDLTTEPERIGEVAAFLPRCGVTSFMPTVISSSPADTERAIDVLQTWRIGAAFVAGGARSLGVHLEGPFLNPDRAGAHPRCQLRPPSMNESSTWSPARGVAMVTLAPELPGAAGVIADLVARGVVVCAGHTDTTSSVLDAAVGAGLSGATHLFNAMGTMSARRPGAVGALLDRGDLIVGLIVDGLHVDPTLVRLAWRLLGAERVALVSDAMAALGLANGDYVIGATSVVVTDDGARTADGVLAGSLLRLDAAVRNLVDFTGCSVHDASIAASTTPARLARRYDIGRLAHGMAADVVLVDSGLRVVATVVAGNVVFDPDGRLSWRS